MMRQKRRAAHSSGAAGICKRIADMEEYVIKAGVGNSVVTHF